MSRRSNKQRCVFQPQARDLLLRPGSAVPQRFGGPLPGALRGSAGSSGGADGRFVRVRRRAASPSVALAHRTGRVKKAGQKLQFMIVTRHVCGCILGTGEDPNPQSKV